MLVGMKHLTSVSEYLSYSLNPLEKVLYSKLVRRNISFEWKIQEVVQGEIPEPIPRYY